MEPLFLVIGFCVSLTVAIISWFEKRRRAEYSKKKRAKKLSQLQTVVATSSILVAGADASVPVPCISPEHEHDIRRAVVSQVESLPLSSREEMLKEIERQMVEVTKRIRKIEERFPPEAQIEKVASINDALLAERIDQLGKQMQAIESRILTKWDVALTVSTIIAGIIFVVGATYAVLRVLGSTP